MVIVKNQTIIDCLQSSDTETRDDKNWHFRKGAFSFSGWIVLLKTWQGENDGYSWKKIAIWWNIKINLQTFTDICGCELPTNLQNFTQKDLTEVKIFYKVLGGTFFWNTL